MKKFIVLTILIASIFASCSNESKKVDCKEIQAIGKDTIVEKPYSNPVLIFDSDFMRFMQSIRKVGDLSSLVNLTSSETIKKFGKEKVKKYYEDNFVNMSKLKLKSVVDNGDGTKTMNYINTVVATNHLSSVDIIVENDTCKLIIKDLNKKLLN
jgi:hypothetical protein